MTTTESIFSPAWFLFFFTNHFLLYVPIREIFRHSLLAEEIRKTLRDDLFLLSQGLCLFGRYLRYLEVNHASPITS